MRGCAARRNAGAARRRLLGRDRLSHRARAACARARRPSAERQRLAQFLSAIEASPNGVLLLDAGDQIEWCNSHAADHFGLDPQRDRRQRVTNLVRVAGVRRLPAGRPVRRAGHLPIPARPGHAGGEGAALRRGPQLLLSQDLTERVRTDAMRRDFVANVSHEIRTPLTVLAGFVETMRNLPLDQAEQQARADADEGADRAHAAPRRRPADAGAARGRSAARRRTAGSTSTP